MSLFFFEQTYFRACTNQPSLVFLYPAVVKGTPLRSPSAPPPGCILLGFLIFCYFLFFVISYIFVFHTSEFSFLVSHFLYDIPSSFSFSLFVFRFRFIFIFRFGFRFRFRFRFSFSFRFSFRSVNFSLSRIFLVYLRCFRYLSALCCHCSVLCDLLYKDRPLGCESAVRCGGPRRNPYLHAGLYVGSVFRILHSWCTVQKQHICL